MIDNTPQTDFDFYQIRKEGKIYISKAFKLSQNSTDTRNVKIVFEDSNIVIAGEINGILTLRQSTKKKQQVLVLVSQEDKQIKRLTLQRFDENKSGDFKTTNEHTFTFRGDEFQKLLAFLKSIEFIDFSNKDNFQIEDLSSNNGNKALIDSSEKAIIKVLKNTYGSERISLLNQIKNNLTKQDIDILLGRKDALEVFKNQLNNLEWSETDWQKFFDSQKWIFGYGLDYRMMTQFDREMNLTSVGTDNKEKVIVDFLMTFKDFTVTVEIKKPDTQIFDKTKNRSGTWSLSKGFIDAVTQVLEQKAEWCILGQNSNNYNKVGDRKLAQRTKDAKSILLIGNKSEFNDIENVRIREIKLDTFELFRRDSRNIEILTYDELFERANFIVNQQ
ncbi:Shedu immune nuclease family protein [Pedobacter mendelii]|uniref:Shedu protein SduA C-terminal domain-containing protein n=1 Tax=Pedobacter mendelii TaxID=1908240 RepID=A0ABQ2BF62_9SPHI|nr:Shedu immune nuclease family protein [Pedobacter mendelii]GGI24739.1 hypothetical protein GCM10008119_14160 [Pedobacter mendelii]